MPEFPHIQTREDVAALKAHSQHSQDNRSYLTMRIEDLTADVNGPEGLLARLVRLEEKISQQERGARRFIAWVAAIVPLAVFAIQYLLGKKS